MLHMTTDFARRHRPHLMRRRNPNPHVTAVLLVLAFLVAVAAFAAAMRYDPAFYDFMTRDRRTHTAPPTSALTNVMLVRAVRNDAANRFDYYVDDHSLTIADCYAMLRVRVNTDAISYTCEFSTDTE